MRLLSHRPVVWTTTVVLAVAVSLIAPPPGAAAVALTVNTTDDMDDGVCDALHCSLREAINAANTSGGADVISFNISPSGAKTISVGSALPSVTDPVTIDGTTQPGFSGSPIIELNGSGAPSVGGIFVNGLTISGGATTVRGLVINRFAGAGIFLLGSSGSVIEGNYIGTNVAGTADLGNTNDGMILFSSSSNTIGGSTASKRNVISGNDDDGISIIGVSTNNLIESNYIGTNAAGTAALGNGFVGIFGGGSGSGVTGNIIRGNVISANGKDGIRLNGAGTTGNVIQANKIGTDVFGSNDLGNAEEGIFLDGGTSANVIGGVTGGVGQGNTISGNALDGILLSGAGSGNTIQNNVIGTKTSFILPLPNDGAGIRILASGTVVGGTAIGEPNGIAFNGQAGIIVNSGTGNVLRRNLIFSNGGLGIDLAPGGVTVNDLGDGDAGANDLQNFPVVTSAVTSGGGMTIQGTLNSTANASFTVEVFASSACDPSGHGEGDGFMGSASVTTNASGNATFSLLTTASVPVGSLVTATATGPSGTSEFSSCFAATASLGADLALTLADLSDPVLASFTMFSYVATVTNSGPGTATGNAVTFSLDPQLVLVNATGCSISGQTITCPIQDLANGATDQVGINVKMATGTAATSVTVSAAVSSATADPVSSNNTDSESTTVKGVVDLQIVSATASPSPVNVSDQFAYTITIKNSASPYNYPATNVVVQMSTPYGPPGYTATFVSATSPVSGSSCGPGSPAGWYGCNLGTLAPNATATVVVTWTAPFAATTLTAQAVASANEPEVIGGNESAFVTVTVVGEQALGMGGSLSTDTESCGASGCDGATPTDPIETSVYLPTGQTGTISIKEVPTSGTPPSGYAFLGQQVTISAPSGTASSPLTITFETYSSLIPSGQSASTIQILRNGVVVPACTNPAVQQAVPDPCVWQRQTLANGNVSITVLTSAASVWGFAVHVPFTFRGFTDAKSDATAGSTVQLRFTLGGDQGLGVVLESSSASCGGGADVVATPGSTRLHYDPETTEYRLQWKTDRAWTGACRTLKLLLLDGSVHGSDIDFR